MQLLNRLCAEERLAALLALGALPIEQTLRYVVAISACLDDSELEVRRAAAEVVAGFGASTSAQAPRLANRLQDVDAPMRARSAGLLGALGTAAAAQLPVLLGALEDADSHVRLEVIKAAGAVGAAAPALAAAALGRRLAADAAAGGTARSACVEALIRLGGGAAEGCGDLLEAEDVAARLAGVEVLRRLGPAAAASQAPRLVRSLLADPADEVRRQALQAVDELGEALSFSSSLALALTDSDAEVRRLALQALGRLGPPALVPHLAEVASCLEDAVPAVRAAAVGSCGRAGAAGDCYVMALARRLDDTDVVVWWAAVEVFSRMGPAAARILSEHFEDPDPVVRCQVRQAVSHMGPSAVPHTLQFAAGLQDAHAAVRRSAASALARAARSAGGAAAAAAESAAAVGGGGAENAEASAFERALADACEDADLVVQRRALESLAAGPVVDTTVMLAEAQARGVALLAASRCGTEAGGAGAPPVSWPAAEAPLWQLHWVAAQKQEHRRLSREASESTGAIA